MEFYALFPEALPLLQAAVSEAFLSAQPDALGPILHAAIKLLLKPDKPADQLPGYRPISLLNTDVRLVAKVIANRLQLPLDLLVDACQSAFIQGRDISDNLLHHLGLAEWLRRHNHPCWCLLVDLAGAYDNVQWDLLFDTMRSMGFREAGHVRWAQLLHRGAHITVLLNGHHTAPFTPSAGLLQGSGASPLYWTIALQPLRRRQAVHHGSAGLQLRLHPACTGPLQGAQ
jgi:hypothetical protein